MGCAPSKTAEGLERKSYARRFSQATRQRKARRASALIGMLAETGDQPDHAVTNKMFSAWVRYTVKAKFGREEAARINASIEQKKKEREAAKAAGQTTPRAYHYVALGKSSKEVAEMEMLKSSINAKTKVKVVRQLHIVTIAGLGTHGRSPSLPSTPPPPPTPRQLVLTVDTNARARPALPRLFAPSPGPCP